MAVGIIVDGDDINIPVLGCHDYHKPGGWIENEEDQ